MTRRLLATLLCLLAACGGSDGPGGTHVVSRVEVNPPSRSLPLFETHQYTAVAREASGGVITGRTVRWSTSDRLVARVSGMGVVMASSPGSATIRASVDGIAARRRSPFPLLRARLPVAKRALHTMMQGSVSLVRGECDAGCSAHPHERPLGVGWSAVDVSRVESANASGWHWNGSSWSQVPWGTHRGSLPA